MKKNKAKFKSLPIQNKESAGSNDTQESFYQAEDDSTLKKDKTNQSPFERIDSILEDYENIAD